MIGVWCDEVMKVGSDPKIRTKTRETVKKKAYIASIKCWIPIMFAFHGTEPSLVG
jgi:hypothetical protein